MHAPCTARTELGEQATAPPSPGYQHTVFEQHLDGKRHFLPESHRIDTSLCPIHLTEWHFWTLTGLSALIAKTIWKGR